MRFPKVECPICGVQVGKPGLRPHVVSHGVAWDPAFLEAKPQVSQTPVLSVVGPDPRLGVSRELAEVALMGLHKTRAEIDGHILDLEAILNPPTRRGRMSAGEVVASTKDTIGFRYERMMDTASGYYRKIWDNDPENLYQHNKLNGQIIVKMDGSPKMRVAPKSTYTRYSKSAPIKRLGRPPKAKSNGHAATV